MNHPGGTIARWLVRARAECGSPAKLRLEAERMRVDNTRELLLHEAQQWEHELETFKRKPRA